MQFFYFNLLILRHVFKLLFNSSNSQLVTPFYLCQALDLLLHPVTNVFFRENIQLCAGFQHFALRADWSSLGLFVKFQNFSTPHSNASTSTVLNSLSFYESLIFFSLSVLTVVRLALPYKTFPQHSSQHIIAFCK